MRLSHNVVSGLTIFNTIAIVLLLLMNLLQDENEVSNASSTFSQPSRTPRTASESAPRPPSTGGMQSGPGGGDIPSIKKLIEDTITPLQKAIADHNADAKAILPSEADVEAAVRSGDMNSEAGKKLLLKLQDGYQKFGMPFPNMGVGTASKSAGFGQLIDETGPNRTVESWVGSTVERLRKELQAQKVAEDGLVPSKKLIAKAITSGSFESQESLQVIEILREGHVQLNMDFPDPIPPPSAPTPNPSPEAPPIAKRQNLEQVPPVAENQAMEPASRVVNKAPEQNTSVTTQEVAPVFSAEQQIVKAYFEGQLQRIELEAKRKSIQVDTCKPTQGDIQKAVFSGNISSSSSRIVLAKLEKCYDRLGLSFYSPIKKK